MARFEARQHAGIYRRTPDPQVLGVDLLSLVLGKNPLLPSPTSTTTDDIIPVMTTTVTNFPVTTTVITTGNDGQPSTVIRTSTQTIVLPTSTNGDDHNNNPAVAPKHGTTTPLGSNINGGVGTSGSQNPSDVVAGGRSTVTVLSESSTGVAMKASLAASKGCTSRCSLQFGTTGTRTGPPGLSPTGGNTDDGPDGDNKGSNLGALIGGIVGAIIGAALLALAIYFLARRARRRRAAVSNKDDATGLLRDDDPFKSIYPSRNRESRMTIDTRQLQRSPSFGTLYGLTYNPDVARGSILTVRNPQSPSTPITPPVWKPFTPSVPTRSESDTTEVRRQFVVGNRSSGGRPLGPGVSPPKADPRSTLSVAADAENPFMDPADHGNETASRETIDVTQTTSLSSGSDYSDSDC